MNRIITHAGPKAHFDEFLAISLLLAEKGSINTPVIRRKKLANQHLNDDKFVVVDIGEEHTPELNNFDHHQSRGLPSSMTLVARHLGLEKAMRKAFDWFEFKDVIDTDGPKAAAEAVGIEGDVRPAQSPVEAYILRTFADQEGEIPRPLVKLMEDFGRSIADRAREFEEKLADARENGAYLTIGGTLTYVRKNKKPDSQVLRVLREENGVKGFDVTITKDPRSGDLAVYRYEDAGHIDFSYASGDEGVHFAHEAGFLATVEDMETARRVISSCNGPKGPPTGEGHPAEWAPQEVMR